jgi:branched-chain amino acid transport system permease protein
MNNILAFQHLKKAFLVALWFCFLTFPIMVIKVNPYEKTVVWRWHNMLYVALASFFLYLLSRAFLGWKTVQEEKKKLRITPHTIKRINRTNRSNRSNKTGAKKNWQQILLNEPKVFLPVLGVLLVLFSAFPFFLSTYQINIMITALMYVVLGLGLNIVVGVAGLLDLGYVAFYAVGAYTYALLNLHFGIGFWTALPIGGLLAACFGILLGFPVLRLRGDYLAIVTLGFGEIIRLVLENWSEFSQGPSGISNVPRPGLFGMEMSLGQSISYLYYLMIALVIFTVFMVNRLQNSRIGRAWFALREDEIACQAMGIDKTKTKLTAFSLGAFWAGMVGVIFAAKTTFVNPSSFTFLESAIILCIVVLGGMGSIIGVIIAALVLMLLPEYLRAFADYRMLVFGATLVIMMVFRPKGLISTVRRTYRIESERAN